MLYFPVERPSDLLISDNAVDLILRMLADKKTRLCSPKYMLNDFAHTKRKPGELDDHPSNAYLRTYRGDYVYPDDATDIKNHPFFRGTRWDELHYRTPPFVPKVKGWEDTKYFDCQQISDVQDWTSEDSGPDEVDQSLGETLEKCAKSEPKRPSTGTKSGNKSKIGKLSRAFNIQCKSQKKKREKKRARDKVLRDEKTGKIALEMRKRTAFVGYTYRRPKDVLLAFEPERGRSLT